MAKWQRFRYYPVLPLGEDGRIITGCQAHIDLSRKAAAEGMVLLIDNPNICGLCYTQLYDVEQEKNGLYTYGREKKFSQEIYDRLRNTMAAKAAMEQ